MKKPLKALFFWWISWISYDSVNAVAHDDGIYGMKIKLHDDLISNYGPISIRPVKNDSSPVNVKMRMLVDHMADFDEPRQQVTLFCAIKMVWRDDFLGWNESEYAGIAFLEVDASQIWSPTVTVLTSNSPDFLLLNHRRLVVSSEGEVSWLSPTIITSTCYFDVQLFPFDVQTCVFEFGPWASPHTVEDLDFFFERNETTVHRYRKNGVWEIVHDTVKKEYVFYSSHEEPFAEIHYHITFRRMSKVYVLGIVIPSVLLSLSTMLIFLLPPESGEKISFGITNLLAMVLFQETVRSAMPPTGSPLLANYICVMVVVACTSLIIEAIVLRMYNLGNVKKVPGWMQRLVCLSKVSRLETPHQNGSIVHPDENDAPEQRLREDEEKQYERCNSPDRPDNPDNAELWKVVALSFEKKAAFIMLFAIVGNIVSTSLQLIVLSMMKSTG